MWREDPAATKKDAEQSLQAAFSNREAARPEPEKPEAGAAQEIGRDALIALSHGLAPDALPPEKKKPERRPSALLLKTIRIFRSAGLFILGFLLFVFSGAIAGQNLIVRTWPETVPYYKAIGLTPAIRAVDLSIQNIRSERRYADGAMRLFVHGEIRNETSKIIVLKPIRIEAVGPDERVIQSWHIDPPAATLDVGRFAPFSTSIPSPEGTVVAVNLSFVERRDDR